ncbi:PQQ-binding-like beta-propeller repeat protein [Streptomyces sp. DASNCL29]|uniref:protein kinase domain-containing protein n=1 Tax=Streptomyces sp. DASNCL29 TaxID=2583819 RepID=UPI00110FB223|nr:PQQ-binding-like beta-propeller repeat protein [Streptomyces sp. DASNCL29]TMU93461.1 serine/threonine protein kinase [Streptomyces sp. DASNCL29]
MPLATGDPESIGGYALLDRLGAGGMGVVYLGRAASGRQVAIKLVHEQYAQDEEFRTRFRQEVAAARRVSGAFTAPVVDADPEADRPWMATLYVPGQTLSEVVRRNGPLSGRELRTLGLGLVEALRDIHRAGVVHRDLKPANILMAEDGPRVIDFGISRAVDSQTLTVTIGRVLGTPPFMSPEQLRSPRGVTGASDVFSLGSLLVYAARGSSPFESDSPYLSGYQVMYEHPTLEGVPEPLRPIAERCLAKEPEARPELDELHRMLRELSDFPAASPSAADTSATVDGHGAASGPATSAVGPPPGSPAPTPTHDAQSPAPQRTASKRGARRRLVVTTTGVAVALTGLIIAAAVFAPDMTDSSGDASATADAAHSQQPASLPKGWQPWRTDLRVATDGPPLVYDEPGCAPEDGRTLYCGGSGFTVARVDAATGRVQWRWGTRPQLARPIGVRDGIVYTYRGAEEGGRSVVALDVVTRKQRWERSVSGSADVHMFRGGVLTLSPDDRELVAYGPSGARLWQSPAPEGRFCEPTALNGAPYALCALADSDGLAADGPYDLLAFDPSDGEQRHLTTLPRKTLSLGAVQGKPLFVIPQTGKEVYDSGYERPYKGLVRVDPRTGEITRIPLKRPVLGKPTLLHGAVYFVRPNGTVTAVAADSGRELWQRVTETESLSEPVLSRRYGQLYFVNRFGRLLALDADDGKEAWRTAALNDPGNSAEDTEPRVVLVKDAIVATAGDTAFSVRPDRPSVHPSVHSSVHSSVHPSIRPSS